MPPRITEWHLLPATLSELCLATTLRCGQSFRWRQCDDNTWSCTLRGRIVQLSQDASYSATHIRYRSIWPKSINNPIVETPPTPPSSLPPPSISDDEQEDDTLPLLNHYLNLTPDLTSLYATWSAADANFARRAPSFTGIRILRQPAWEALFGFICSSNNNILRIAQMVDKLCIHYGTFVADFGGRKYYDFPAPERLTGEGVEAHLRELGFGYRAKYIAKTAAMVVEQGSDWLDGLRNPDAPAYDSTKLPLTPSTSAMPTEKEQDEFPPQGRPGYVAAHAALLTLQGVGPKVADCVCLMGLGWDEAVPVDTHVWQIACRDYKFGNGKGKAANGTVAMTKGMYEAVGDYFRGLWGSEAGWAHSVLFAADLRVLKREQEEARFKVETIVEVKEKKPEKDRWINGPRRVKQEDVEGEVKTQRTKKSMVTRTVVKREREDDKSVLQLDQLTVGSSERVKRRRRG